MSKCKKQCLLIQGLKRLTTWIDVEYAKKDICLSLKNPELGEEGIWQVLQVYEPALPADLVESNSRDYKRTRKHSDI